MAARLTSMIWLTGFARSAIVQFRAAKGHLVDDRRICEIVIRRNNRAIGRRNGDWNIGDVIIGSRLDQLVVRIYDHLQNVFTRCNGGDVNILASHSGGNASKAGVNVRPPRLDALIIAVVPRWTPIRGPGLNILKTKTDLMSGRNNVAIRV